MSSLSSIQGGILRYVFPISLTLGNIGNIFIIIIFSQKHHRKNSCSLYLLVAAIFSIIGISWGIGSNMYSAYYPPDPFTQSLFLCRFRAYILQSSILIYKIMILLACIDRFALSSANVRIRSFSTQKVAIKVIVGSILFGLSISIHLPLNQDIQNNRCFVIGTYGLFFSIYQICIYGLILPIAQIIFALLIAKNLKRVRIRVRPQLRDENESENVLSTRDVTLIKLVLAEIIVGIILTTFYPINRLYTVLASDVPNRSADRIAIESFLVFICLNFLLYLNYCVTFYLYIVISKAFRKETKRFILEIIRQSDREHTNSVPTIPAQRRTMNPT